MRRPILCGLTAALAAICFGRVATSVAQEVAFASSFNPSAVLAGDTTCDSCSSVAKCECDCSRWYLRGESLFLTRDDPERLDLIQDDEKEQSFPINFFGNDHPRPTVLHTRSGDFSFEPGFRVTLGRQLDGCRAIEASYFGLYNLNSTADVESVDEDMDSLMMAASFFPDTAPFMNFYSDFDSASYRAETEVHNVAVNLRRQYNSVFTFLAGFRYIHVDDNFSILTSEEFDDHNDHYGTRRYDIDTNSDLFGFELGGELNYNVLDNLCVELKGKAGLHLGWYQQDQVNLAHTEILEPGRSTITAGTIDWTTGDDAWGMASTVDVGATAVYQVTDNVDFRIGYETMVWSGLALAPEQLNDSNDGRETHRDGIIVLSGGTVGLEVTR